MAGKKVLSPLVKGSYDHLVSGGSLQLVVPSKKGLRLMEKLLEKSFGNYKVIGKGSGYKVLQSIKTTHKD
jgi:16S rRNA (guanine1207-N2)-methyltransferase